MMKKWVNIDGSPKDSDTSTISFNDIVRMVCRIYEGGIYMDKSKGIDWRELKDWNYSAKKEILQELRKSTNYIIQSENAMVIYEALIRLDKKLTELGWQDKVYLMTTIYDACYLSVDNSISDKKIKEVLTEVFEVWYNKDFMVDAEV